MHCIIFIRIPEITHPAELKFDTISPTFLHIAPPQPLATTTLPFAFIFLTYHHYVRSYSICLYVSGLFH